MALNANRLRRALSLSSTFLATRRNLPTTTTAAATTDSLLQNLLSSSSTAPSSSPFRRRFFHSTHISLSSSRSFNDAEKIDPDTILFEGCDYKHWLITMDFGKDPKQYPPPEQMVETYVQTLAKVVGSVEEAKKRMYACSTTTYTGFQAEMDEETSQKFEGMPGVVFILPDSYIDPVNKEYGGDKYINGTIIPRPPPVQYGRVRQNYLRPMPNPMPREGRANIAQSGFPERQNTPFNYGPTVQGGRSNPMPSRTNNSEHGRDGYQGGGHSYVPPQQGGGTTYVPPYQGGGNASVPPHQGGGTTYVPPYQGGGNASVPPHQGGGTTYVPPYQGGGNASVPPHQGNFNHGYTQQHQMENFPGDRGNRPGERGYNHPQGQMNNFHRNHGGYTAQGQMDYPSDGRNYAPPPPGRGTDGQTGVRSFEQSGAGQYGQGPNGTSGQGASIRYAPGYAFQTENQRYSQTPDEQNSMSTEQRNYSPAMETGMNQRKF